MYQFSNMLTNVQNNDNVTITFFFCYVKIAYNVTHNVGYVI